MRIKKLLAFFLSMSFIVCSLPTLVSADEVDSAGSADDPVVEDVGGSSDSEDVAGAPADVKQGDNGSGEVKGGSGEVSGAPVVRGQNDNDGGSGDTVYSGTCGVGVYWDYDPLEHKLFINGPGSMADYQNGKDTPWTNFRAVIKAVNIEQGVENIGNEAFDGCSSLTSVTIPNSVKTIGDFAFDGCSSLTSVTIPDSVVTIGDNAFDGCENLESVSLPANLTSIGEFAFCYCKSLKALTIPSRVSTLGGFVFNDCSVLTKITSYADPSQLDVNTFFGIKNQTIIYVPHEYFVKYCSRFSALSNQIEDIDTGEHGDGGTTITTSPTDNPITGTPDRKITASGNCGIGVNWTLYEDGELYIHGIGNMNDYSESSIPWADYKEYINTVTIDSGVTKIGDNAFNDLDNVRSFTIPENVKILGKNVFRYCGSLENIYCYADPSLFDNNAFNGVFTKPKLHVKERFLNKYKRLFDEKNICLDLSYIDFVGNNVTLSNEIGINFYLDISKDIDVSDLSVQFSWGTDSYSKTEVGDLSGLRRPLYGANYFVYCYVAARCMTDNVKMTVKRGKTTVVTSTFKIVDYAKDLAELYPAEDVDTSDYIGLDENEQLHTLLIAMLNYGAACQKYFNYRTNDLANASKYTKNLVKVGSVRSSTKNAYSNYDAAKISLIAAKNTIANIGDDNIGLAYDGSAVACKSKMSLRIYFTKTEGFDISKLSASYKGNSLTFKESGDSVYIEIGDMSPIVYAPKGSDLFDCGLTININGKDYTYNYLDYVQKCVATENGFEDTAVALAVYSYFATNY